MVEAWLDDGHADVLCAVEHTQFVVCPKTIEPHLGISLGGNFHPFAEFKINHLDVLVGDEDEISRAESLRHPRGEIQPAFHENLGIGGCGSRLADFLHAYIHILPRSVPHLLGHFLGLSSG